MAYTQQTQPRRTNGSIRKGSLDLFRKVTLGKAFFCTSGHEMGGMNNELRWIGWLGCVRSMWAGRYNWPIHMWTGLLWGGKVRCVKKRRRGRGLWAEKWRRPTCTSKPSTPTAARRSAATCGPAPFLGSQSPPSSSLLYTPHLSSSPKSGPHMHGPIISPYPHSSYTTETTSPPQPIVHPSHPMTTCAKNGIVQPNYL